jgi:hypothetical protein
MENYKAILIDPFKREITEIETTGIFEDMYAQLTCDMLEFVRLSAADVIWVDEEGAFKAIKRYFYFDSMRLSGRAMVLGMSRGGQIHDAQMDLETIQERVRFTEE